MLVTKEVEVKYNNNNYKYYLNLGYDFKYGDIINIPIYHLSKGCDKLVEVKCDICEKIRKIPYKNYIKCHTFDIDVCDKKGCSQIKIKKANLLKYGNECYYFTEDFIKKSNKTKLDKYNDINYNNPEKNKKTCLEKYGVEHAIQLEKFKSKSNQTKIERYGNENFTNREQSKKTCLEKYGVNNTTKVPEINKKIVNSRIKRRLKSLFEFGIKDLTDDNEYICVNNHKFKIDSDLMSNRYHYKTTICPICNPVGSYNRSGSENILYEFIKKNYENEILCNNKKIIPPYEIDIYLPDLKLAFEFNGLFWHNEISTDKNYHLNKTELCEKQNIKLIHIYEDDWCFKKNTVKSNIIKLLTNEKIILDDYKIKEINDSDAKNFIDINDLICYKKTKMNIGLFYEDEIICLMCINKNDDIKRFCDKLYKNYSNYYKILLDYYINKYEPNKIIYEVNRSWPIKDVIIDYGFKIKEKTKPNCYYINKKHRVLNREKNLLKIYDSGNLKLIFENNKNKK